MPRLAYRTGVYVILNQVNDKVYVGGAYKDYDNRFSIHKRDLRAGRHNNKHLQAAWDKYGESSFIFLPMYRCHPDVLPEKETEWIKSLNATDRKHGYNRSPTGGSPLGTKHSEEYKAAVSARNLNMSAETKAKIGAASKGRIPSKETREKIGAASRGKKRPQEVIDKIAARLKGQKRSEEAKARMSEAGKKRFQDPKERKKIGNANKGRKHTSEEIVKRAAGIKLAWENKEDNGYGCRKRY